MAITEEPPIKWYRTKLDNKVLKMLNQRNDLKALNQALGHLLLLTAAGLFSVYAYEHLSWMILVIALFIYGTICRFLTNGIHELMHGTAFKTRWLNILFLQIFSFLRWENYHRYWGSHTEHHKFTLYPAQDSEVLLPTKFTLSGFLREAIFDPLFPYRVLKENIRYALGFLDTEWDRHLFEGRAVHKEVIRWARVLLLGHAAIAMITVYTGYWMIFVLLSLGPMYGGLFFFLCNNTQHSGLQDKVPDFRLSCRTIYLNPILEFLYWKMNYHTEHHMYAAVPFYNLPKLHEAIKHDLPPTQRGLVRTWQEILNTQSRQVDDPDYQYVQKLPEHS